MLPLVASDFSSIASVLGWSAVLLAILLVAFFAYTQFKRWMQSPEDTASAGFTLSDLRDLHRQGKLSKEEFDIAKTKILATIKPSLLEIPSTKLDRNASSKNVPPGDDPKPGP